MGPQEIRPMTANTIAVWTRNAIREWPKKLSILSFGELAHAAIGLRLFSTKLGIACLPGKCMPKLRNWAKCQACKSQYVQESVAIGQIHPIAPCYK